MKVFNDVTNLRSTDGFALILTMLVVLVMGALVTGAAMVGGNHVLANRYYERTNQLDNLAASGLELARATVNGDPTVYPDSGHVTLEDGAAVTDGYGVTIPGVRRWLYVGPTGVTSGQYGIFGSIISIVRDDGGGEVVRRSQVYQESFAKFAYFTDNEPSNIYFGGGDQIFGPVHSNSKLKIHSTGATFHKDVRTAQTVQDPGYGTFMMGYEENAPVIPMPQTADLNLVAAQAAAGGTLFTGDTNGQLGEATTRIEFIAIDLNADGDATDDDEGFFKVYQSTDEAWVSGTSDNDLSNNENCGAWYVGNANMTFNQLFADLQFHIDNEGGLVAEKLTQAVLKVNDALSKVAADPSAAVSDLLGAKSEIDSADNEGLSGGDANDLRDLVDAIIADINGGGNGQGNGNGNIFVAAADHPYNGNTGLEAVQSATRRCYLGGADSLYNGFQSTDAYGGWLDWTSSAAYPGAVAPGVAARPDKDFLFPLARIYNPDFKGVISVTGKVVVSGVVRGRVTLTATDDIILGDDIIYATDPGAGLCQDMLGMFAGDKVVVADNLLNAPQKPSAPNDYITYDDTKDEFFHGIILALDIFTVENYNNGSRNDESCEATVWGRGCIYLTGGVIQTTRGAVGLSNGSGYLKRYSYDGCAAEEPPPYFPTTGHFSRGQYYQVDPTGFSVPTYYEMLTP